MADNSTHGTSFHPISATPYSPTLWAIQPQITHATTQKMEIIGFIIIEVAFSAIGWICLSVWYRDRKKIEKIKEAKYAGHYSGAGRVFVLNLIAGIGAIIMFGVVIAVLVSWTYKLIAN